MPGYGMSNLFLIPLLALTHRDLTPSGLQTVIKGSAFPIKRDSLRGQTAEISGINGKRIAAGCLHQCRCQEKAHEAYVLSNKN